MRWATRAPRSCPTIEKFSNPSAAMTCIKGRLATVALPAQIRGDNGEVLGKFWRYFVPDNVRLRLAMKQKKRGSAASNFQIDFCLIDDNALALKSAKHIIFHTRYHLPAISNVS